MSNVGFLSSGNGRDSGIAGWENMGTGFKFQMGMGMKSLKWEGIGTKNLFPHTSSSDLNLVVPAVPVAHPWFVHVTLAGHWGVAPTTQTCWSFTSV